MVERLVWVQQAAGSNPVTLTCFRVEPFDEHIEGLSRCGDETYALCERSKRYSQTARLGAVSGWVMTGFEPHLNF